MTNTMHNGPKTARIVLITGNMASGKSTVAQALAERLPKSVHIRGDMFRRVIVSGRAEMSSCLSKEAEEQLNLRYKLSRDVVKRYHDAGFAVIYQDIIIGSALTETVESFRGYPLSVIVLCPDEEAIMKREEARDKNGYGSLAEIKTFSRVLHSETPRLGYWLDTSQQSVAETVQLILAHLKEDQQKAS